MDSWRRQRCDNYNPEGGRTRSQNRKPPLGSWQPTVPSWEKRFCTVIGSVPWRKVLDTKKIIHLYDNVLKWNDSAGEEAFINAKNRFWADINGLPCEMSLPDPDIYIDKIDWNSNVDPELILDLEREPIVPANQDKGEQVVILSDQLVSNYFFSSTGWGDAEDDKKKTASSLENKGNQCEDNHHKAKESVGHNGWENIGNDSWGGNQGTGDMKDSGWGDSWNNSCGWNQGTGDMKDGGWGDGWNNSSDWNQWGNINCEYDNFNYGKNSGVWEPCDANHRNQEFSGGYMARYKTSRFHDDGNPTTQDWRNGKGRKRANFVHERPYRDNRHWNMVNSCAPVRHQGSARQRNQWSWEKPVS